MRHDKTLTLPYGFAYPFDPPLCPWAQESLPPEWALNGKPMGSVVCKLADSAPAEERRSFLGLGSGSGCRGGNVGSWAWRRLQQWSIRRLGKSDHGGE